MLGVAGDYARLRLNGTNETGTMKYYDKFLLP